MLNKLDLPGTVWIASDTHLGPDAPNTQKAFLAFLAQARQQANALILAGDIFEAWIGDDLACGQPPQWLAQVLNALKETSGKLDLFLVRGNRDFLMGHGLAREIGARLLGDQTLLHTAAGSVLLSHGDEYCTDDMAYQRLRHWVRKPWVQSLYLSLALPLRQRIAAWARSRSRQSSAGKPMMLLDVNAQSVMAAFERSGAQLMVHGHTHRPATHTYDVNGRSCLRYVLPDWDFDHPGTHRGGWLGIDASGLHMHQASNSSCN